MDRKLDADQYADAQDDPHHREKGPHFVESEMPESNLSEKKKKGDHKIRNPNIEIRNGSTSLTILSLSKDKSEIQMTEFPKHVLFFRFDPAEAGLVIRNCLEFRISCFGF